MNNPHKNKKVASLFLFLIYEEYPSNILMVPNNATTIDVTIPLLIILKRPKTTNIIIITEINVLLALKFFNLLPPQ
jgi:hypothetical protein